MNCTIRGPLLGRLRHNRPPPALSTKRHRPAIPTGRARYSGTPPRVPCPGATLLATISVARSMRSWESHRSRARSQENGHALPTRAIALDHPSRAPQEATPSTPAFSIPRKPPPPVPLPPQQRRLAPPTRLLEQETTFFRDFPLRRTYTFAITAAGAMPPRPRQVNQSRGHGIWRESVAEPL
jgi:hypothetical protein